jgi:endoglycosylceramidase
VLLVLCASTAHAAVPRLGHAGRWNTDADGRVVILHGVNMVYKRPPYDLATPGFGADDAAFLRRIGFNTVRVGVIWKAVEPRPGAYDDAYLASIERTVRTLARYGIHSMLDFHQDMYNERFQGEGAPDWAVIDDGLPALPQLGFSNNYFLMPALIRAFDHFWANDPGPGGVGLQDRFAAAWRHVAERFRSVPGVMGYEILNEPWPGSAWPTCANNLGCPTFDNGPLAGLSRRVLAAIRSVDRRTMFWYEPEVLFNFGANSRHPRLPDARVGFAFHDYCLIAGAEGSNFQSDPLRGAECEPFESINAANAERHGSENGEALLLTEFGATDDLSYIRRLVNAAERRMMSWQYWHYCPCADPTTSGPGAFQAIVLDPKKAPEGNNLKTAKIGVLARPYPRAVAGTPTRYRFDEESHVFRAEFSTTLVSGRRPRRGLTSEFFVPRLQYPRGYTAYVGGARVVSRRNADVLRLRRCAGADAVSVRIEPGPGAPHQPRCRTR